MTRYHHGNCFTRLVYFADPSAPYPVQDDMVLDGVLVRAEIIDVHAKVHMSQKFTNPVNFAVEASYMFAILATSNVAGFEMVRGDGTKITGSVMEKVEAKAAYDNAISQGQTASLGEEQTKDLFSIKVGNILPSETVTINLTFLTTLTDDEKSDQVRFTFPRAYASRYGTAPTLDIARSSLSTGAAQKFSIQVLVQQAGFIKSISCPSSHPIELSLGRPEDITIDESIPDSNFASVELTSPTEFLTHDFVLVVTAKGLDGPRCFVEKREDTTAVAITFVPRFTLPDVDGGMEYIFVLDRSGSMQGTRITLLQEAMIVLLRGLPSKSTTFNIVSFGTRTTKLWNASKEYTQKTLDEATAHCDALVANYGGTEITKALETTFKSLPKNRTKPVSIFLLTDGGAHQIEDCVSITREALSSPGSFIRVFTIGIGSGVSTDTVESIARAGDAMSIYVQEGEAMTGKCARLVRAARTPPVNNIQISWPVVTSSEKDADDDDFEMVAAETTPAAPTKAAPINLFGDSAPPADVGPPAKIKPESITASPVQQAPLKIASLFPGTRTQIYAILENSSLQQGEFPAAIRVSGTVATSGAEVELYVQVAKTMSPFIHTLAAGALITDREDGKKINDSDSAEYLEADIVRLGVKYGLSSKHTSFIAIDERKQDLPVRTATVPEIQVVQTHAYVSPSYRSSSNLPPGYRGRGGGGSIHKTGGSSKRKIMDATVYGRRAPPGAAGVSLGVDESSASPKMKKRSVHTRDRDASVLGSYEPYLLPSPAPQPAIGYSCALDESDESPSSKGFDGPSSRLAALARLQQFDGGLSLTVQLLNAINTVEKRIQSVLSAVSIQDTELVATLLAILWLEKTGVDGGEDMRAKAEDWVQDHLREAGGMSFLEAKDLVKKSVPFV